MNKHLALFRFDCVRSDEIDSFSRKILDEESRNLKKKKTVSGFLKETFGFFRFLIAVREVPFLTNTKSFPRVWMTIFFSLFLVLKIIVSTPWAEVGYPKGEEYREKQKL